LGIGLTNVRAHDEGHGPKLTDVAKQGGVVSPVIDMKDSKKGAKAAIVYKAELVRAEDGMVSVYLYDKEMNVLDIAKFGQAAKGYVETEKKGKISKAPFELKRAEGVFAGQSPKPSTKPFNIDVTFKEGERELLVAFDNLD
jgi:hypothetical protein